MGKGCYWWSEYGDFPPEDERERAPSPSAVLESYRIAGKVSFPQLAAEMDLSEKMARRIFHQGDGLDFMSRRRILARRLKIPPELLGLDRLHWNRPNTCWWTLDGYPAFSMDADGYPHPGEVVRWHRKKMRKRDINEKLVAWRQEDLGEVCIPSLSLESVNKMERHCVGLDSMSRRRALVSLLGIPPALLGLDATKHERAIPGIPSPTLLLSGGLTDDMLLLFEQRQEEIFIEYFNNHGQNKVGEVNWWIPYLQNEALPLTQGDQQYMWVRSIERQYHRFMIDIAHEQRDYGEALYQANTLIAIAEEMEDTEYLILALFFRARTFRDQGVLFYNMAQADTDRALALIKQSKRAIVPPVAGLLTQEAGVVHFLTAQIKDDREVAKSLMRQAERLSLQAVEEVDTYRLKQNPGYYHLGAAIALANWYNPVTFNAHLDEATRLTDPSLQRRHLVIKVVCAQGELLNAKHSSTLARDKHYAEATRLATEAFDVAKKLNSRLNRHRIQQIYNELKNSPYGEEPTVAHLGLLLELWP